MFTNLKFFALLGLPLIAFLAMSLLAEAPHEMKPNHNQHPVLQIVNVEDQPWYEAEDKAVAREIASPRNSKLEKMSIAEIIIPSGVAVVPHHHMMEEVYYIVSGEGTMMVEDETAIVRAGQSVVIAPHQWHNIVNHTENELRLIVTCAPSWAPEHLLFERIETEKE